MTMDLLCGEAFPPSVMKVKVEGSLYLTVLEVGMGVTVHFFPAVLPGPGLYYGLAH